MAYCPQCLAEYVEGARQCVDCGVALAPGPPPAPAGDADAKDFKLVRLRIFTGPTASLDAELARSVLEEEGILSVVPATTFAEHFPGLEPITLLVREADAEEAAEILRGFLDEPPKFVGGDPR